MILSSLPDIPTTIEAYEYITYAYALFIYNISTVSTSSLITLLELCSIMINGRLTF